MQASQHDLLRTLEDRHWWYAVLHHQVLQVLSDRLERGGRILDAGCGTGGMMCRLSAQWSCLGVDVSPAAVGHACARGLEARVGRVEALPLDSLSADAVLSLDVLYHEQVEPEQAMGEMARVLKPGGILVLNVAAFRALRGSHDGSVCGARRYTASQVRSLLERHSFKPDMIHYWNAWLFLPLLMHRLVSRWTHENRTSDLRPLPSALNLLLEKAGKLDARLCRVLRVPFGSSVFAWATRLPQPPEAAVPEWQLGQGRVPGTWRDFASRLASPGSYGQGCVKPS